MFCPQCRTQIEEHFKFCSRCGASVAAEAAAAPKERDMDMHVKVLAWIFVGVAVLTATLGMTVLLAGQLIERLPIPWPLDIPVDIAGLVTTIVAAVGFSMVLTAGGIAAAGIGLLYYRNWGRVLAVIMSVFLLFKFPIGTAIAIYAFWVLLSEKGRAHFSKRAQAMAG